MKSFLILLQLVFIPILNFAEELVVHLQTENSLDPIYVGKILVEKSELSSSHIDELNKAFAFDFKHNGYTSLLDSQAHLEGHLHQKTVNSFDATKWQRIGAHYVLSPKLQNNSLILRLFDVRTSNLKEFKEILLTTSLEDNVQLIHKASDMLHQVLYHREGIASKKILYAFKPSADPQDWSSEIWEMGYDGSFPKQITSEGSYCLSPVAIPKSARNGDYHFLYVCYKHGQPKIYMSLKKGSQGSSLVSLRGNQILPSISPTADKIAFVGDASGQADLFIQPFQMGKGTTDKPMQVYSFSGSVQASSSFSPDGSKLAFVSDKEGTPRVYLIDLLQVIKEHKTPQITCISKENRENTSPSWSPDGKKIVYSAKTNNVRQIWLYDLEKEEEKQLTFGPAVKENPSWAPNGLHLVYNTTSPTFDLFLLNINHPEPIKITNGPGTKHYPAWTP